MPMIVSDELWLRIPDELKTNEKPLKVGSEFVEGLREMRLRMLDGDISEELIESEGVSMLESFITIQRSYIQIAERIGIEDADLVDAIFQCLVFNGIRQIPTQEEMKTIRQQNIDSTLRQLTEIANQSTSLGDK